MPRDPRTSTIGLATSGAGDLPRDGRTGPPAIRAVELTREFGDLVAVNAVSIEIVPGEIFGLVGPNGAGKSTMIKMLTTLLSPTSGQAWVAGFDVRRQAGRVRRRIGYIPQALSADGALTGYENLLLSARLYGIPRAEREQRIQEALLLVGLRGYGDTIVRQYSGGMIRRLEIAQSMLHRPAVLFMDEPTVGLDPVARRTIWQHIRYLREVFGTTMLITTHMMDEAEELCDRVAVMHRGAAVVAGSPAALKARVGPDATMDDVFVHFSGATIDSGGTYREVVRTRRVFRRLS